MTVGIRFTFADCKQYLHLPWEWEHKFNGFHQVRRLAAYVLLIQDDAALFTPIRIADDAEHGPLCGAGFHSDHRRRNPYEIGGYGVCPQQEAAFLQSYSRISFRTGIAG